MFSTKRNKCASMDQRLMCLCIVMLFYICTTSSSGIRPVGSSLDRNNNSASIMSSTTSPDSNTLSNSPSTTTRLVETHGAPASSDPSDPDAMTQSTALSETKDAASFDSGSSNGSSSTATPDTINAVISGENTATFDTNTSTFDKNTATSDTNTSTFDKNTSTLDTKTATFVTNTAILTTNTSIVDTNIAAFDTNNSTFDTNNATFDTKSATTDDNTGTDTDDKLTAEDLETMATSDIMEFYVIPVLAGLGVGGNTLALVVWSKERTFNACTFLIKCLAVSDLCFCLVKAISVSSWTDSLQVLRASFTVYTLGRVLSVNTTLAIVFIRWLAVSKPLRVHQLLTKRRTLWGYGSMFAWCVLVATVESLLLWDVFPGIISGLTGMVDENAYMALRFTLQGLSLVLPIFLLVLLNVNIVCILCRRGRSDINSTLGQRSVDARETQLNRLLAAVVCLSVTTVLTYPLGLLSDTLMIVSYEDLVNACGTYCYLRFYRASDFLESFNSSINVVFYVMFSLHFRHLLRLRFSFCCRCQTIE